MLVKPLLHLSVATITMNSRKPPGKQKRVYKLNNNFIVLYLFIFVFVAIAIFSLVKDNWPCYLPPWLSQLKILTFSEAITAVISLSSLYFVLEGFELNYRPLLSYNTQVLNEVKSGKKPWQVFLKNGGNGSAIIEKIEFEFQLMNRKEVLVDFTEIVQELGDIEKGKNFNLINISPGASISNAEELILFEFPSDKLNKIKRFDIKLTFKSFLGQLYQKEIYLLPLNKTTHEILYKS